MSDPRYIKCDRWNGPPTTAGHFWVWRYQRWVLIRRTARSLRDTLSKAHVKIEPPPPLTRRET